MFIVSTLTGPMPTWKYALTSPVLAEAKAPAAIQNHCFHRSAICRESCILFSCIFQIFSQTQVNQARRVQYSNHPRALDISAHIVLRNSQGLVKWNHHRVRSLIKTNIVIQSGTSMSRETATHLRQ